jgi:hypothetical protein
VVAGMLLLLRLGGMRVGTSPLLLLPSSAAALQHCSGGLLLLLLLMQGCSCSCCMLQCARRPRHVLVLLVRAEPRRGEQARMLTVPLLQQLLVLCEGSHSSRRCGHDDVLRERQRRGGVCELRRVARQRRQSHQLSMMPIQREGRGLGNGQSENQVKPCVDRASGGATVGRTPPKGVTAELYLAGQEWCVVEFMRPPPEELPARRGYLASRAAARQQPPTTPQPTCNTHPSATHACMHNSSVADAHFNHSSVADAHYKLRTRAGSLLRRPCTTGCRRDASTPHTEGTCYVLIGGLGTTHSTSHTWDHILLLSAADRIVWSSTACSPAGSHWLAGVASAGTAATTSLLLLLLPLLLLLLLPLLLLLLLPLLLVSASSWPRYRLMRYLPAGSVGAIQVTSRDTDVTRAGAVQSALSVG